MNEIDRGLIKKLIKTMNETDHELHQCAWWGSINAAGNVKINDIDACHAGLSNHRQTDALFIANRRQIYNSTNEKALPEEVEDFYLRWLTKDSPYASIFVRKGGPSIRKIGYTVCRTDVPAQLLAGGLIAHRRLWEYNHIPLVMFHLVNEGVHPDVAYCFAHQVMSSDNKLLNIDMACSGHCSWDGNNFSRKTVENFLAHNMSGLNDNKTWFDGSHKYSPTSYLWEKGRNLGYGRATSYLSEKLADIAALVKKENKEKTSANPFKAGNAKKLYEVELVPFCKEWAKLLKEEFPHG